MADHRQSPKALPRGLNRCHKKPKMLEFFEKLWIKTAIMAIIRILAYIPSKLENKMDFKMNFRLLACFISKSISMQPQLQQNFRLQSFIRLRLK